MNKQSRLLIRAELKSSHLPARLHLAGDLSALDMELVQLWELTDAGEPKVQWGSCIVAVDNSLRLEHRTNGRFGGVVPACRPKAHDHYVGFAHTHLPDAQTGKAYPGFSDRDFAGSLFDGDCLAPVCNGVEVYLLVRTADQSAPPRKASRQELIEWASLYEERIQQARCEMKAELQAGKKESDALNRALLEANLEMCRRLGFAFYRGRWGQPLLRIFRP